MSEFSAIIVGGGPAGTATALALQRLGHSALVVERSRYADWRVGETLPPYARVPLAALGVWDAFLEERHLPSHAIHSAWGSTELYENDFIFDAYGTGWHLDRKRFDSMLARAAGDAGAMVLEGMHVRAVSRSADRWHVVVDGEETRIEAQAPFLVDATGRAAWIARSRGSRRLFHDRMVGVIANLMPEAPGAAADAVLMLEAVEDGWWYSAPVPDGSLLVAYMTDGDLLTGRRSLHPELWTARLDLTVHTAARCRGFRLTGDVRLRPASSGPLDTAAGPGWAAVGDAASVYDPLSAAGICKALQSGLAAGKSIGEYLAGNNTALDEYAATVVERFEDYLKQRITYYGREGRWPDSPFWRRRSNDSWRASAPTRTPA